MGAVYADRFGWFSSEDLITPSPAGSPAPSAPGGVCCAPWHLQYDCLFNKRNVDRNKSPFFLIRIQINVYLALLVSTWFNVVLSCSGRDSSRMSYDLLFLLEYVLNGPDIQIFNITLYDFDHVTFQVNKWGDRDDRILLLSSLRPHHPNITPLLLSPSHILST